jgi:hypothetical protein
VSSAAIRWGAGIVALGAVVATAHGLFEVAAAARVPDAIALTYPLITDGLALVAYASTTRLTGAASRYAWAVVVLAAGLSGTAQAAYLATDVTSDGTGAVVLVLHPALRFGIGAWPAIAAALVAHLLYLLVAAEKTSTVEPAGPTVADVVQPVEPEAPSHEVPAPEPVESPAEWSVDQAAQWALGELRTGTKVVGWKRISTHTGLTESPARRAAAQAKDMFEHPVRPVVNG